MQSAGRVLLLRCRGVVDGSAPSPLAVSQEAKSKNAKLVVVDTTDAHYADSAGLRWLIELQDTMGERGGPDLRVVASPAPRDLVELATLRVLLDSGVIVLAAGGDRKSTRLNSSHVD